MFEGETSLGVYGDGGRELYVGGPKAYVYKCSCLANEALKDTVWHEILRVLIFCDFCVFSAIHKKKFPQIKITAKHFPAKIYSGVNILRLKFTTQNTVLRNRVCSITTCLFRSETESGIQWNTDADRSIGPVLFENMHFYCTYSIKTKILSMLGTGTFWKSQK